MWTAGVLLFVAIYSAGRGSAGLGSGRTNLRRTIRRESPPGIASDMQALAGALVVGAVAGLSLQKSLERARSVLGQEQIRELDSLLRDAQRMGLAAALSRSTGSMSPLFGRLARAHVSGAPLAATVVGFATEERDRLRAERIELARKLPVRLSIPLALLVLPGFILLTAGPAVIGSLQRMLGPLMP